MANSVIFALLLFIISWCCVVVVAAAQLQWLRWLIRKLLRHHNHPPGPLPIPVLGNLLHLVSSSAPHRSLAQLARKYGPIFHLQLGVLPTVVVSTPSAAQQVLHAHDRSLASRPHVLSFYRLLYGFDTHSALISPYKDRWRSIRKFYSLHMFSAARHQELHVPVVRQEIHRVLMGHVYAASRDGSLLNLSQLFCTLVQTIMHRIVLHKHPANLHTFAREIERLGSMNRIGDFLPFLRFLDRSLDGAIDRCHRTMDAIMEGVVAERDEEMKTDQLAPRGGDDGKDKEQKKNHNSILDVMLASDPPMERDAIKAMILELIVAGTTTTATALEWVMAELLNNERAMRKAVEEVDGVVGKDRMVSSEDVTPEKMPYIKAVVKETLRLHPPSPLLFPHYALETCDVTLQQQQQQKKKMTNSGDDDVDDDDGQSTCEVAYRIAAGTRIIINAWAIGRDEMTWGPTANQFVPERFMGVDREVDVRGHDFGLLPFGSGRRMCPAFMLAMSMLELTIATFVHCFDWKKSDEGPVDMTDDFGINLILRSQLFSLPTSFRLPSIPTTTPNGIHPDDQ